MRRSTFDQLNPPSVERHVLSWLPDHFPMAIVTKSSLREPSGSASSTALPRLFTGLPRSRSATSRVMITRGADHDQVSLWEK